MASLTPELQTLFKKITATANQFPIAGFRDYFIRNTKTKFDKFSASANSDALTKQFTSQMTEQLHMLERQVAINKLYYIDHVTIRR